MALRDRVYFAARTNAVGREVWSSDGSASGTSLLHDLEPAWRDSNPMHLLIILGTQLTRVPIGFGCELLVGQVLSHLPLTTDRTGSATVPLTVSLDPVLLHLELDLQPVVLDPAGPWNGLASFGAGLSLRIDSLSEPRR